MRCREVKRRMIDAAGEYDHELIEHLRVCPSCADAAEATGLLKQILTRDEQEPLLTFDQLRDRVETAADNQTTLEKIMSSIKLAIFTRPKLAASLGLGLLFFLFIMLVPFSYTSITGYKIIAPLSRAVPSVERKLIETAISGIGYKGVTVAFSDQPYRYIISGVPTKGDAEALSAILKDLIPLEAEPSIEPIRAVVSGSIYAQAVEKVRPPDEKKETKIRLDKNKIYLNGLSFEGSLLKSDLSDAEVTAKVEEALRERGFEPGELTVNCSTNADGTRILSLGVPGGSNEAAFRLDIGTDTDKNLQFRLYTDNKPLRIEGPDGKIHKFGDKIPRLILKFSPIKGNGKEIIIDLDSNFVGK